MSSPKSVTQPFRWSMVGAAGMILWSTLASAQSDDVARIRNGLESKSPVWVGQETTFYVELLSSSFFSGTPRFAVPEIPGAVVMKVDGRPVMGSTKIDGETWTSQRHTFRVYAQRAGDYEVPSFAVRFSVSAGFKEPPQPQRIMTEAIRWEAKMPPGAEGLSLLISTSSLEAKQNWQGIPKAGNGDDEPITLAVGDAITRTITLAAEDVPGMALPAISMPAADGMTSYAQAPVVDDRTNRGTLTGSRSDSVTYVCQRAGAVTLPAMVVTWWDIKAEQLRRINLDGLRLEVTEPLSQGGEVVGDVEIDTGSNHLAAWAIVAVIVFVTAIFLFRRILTDRWLAWNRRHLESESAAFAAVKKACRGDDPAKAYNALMRWIGKRSGGTRQVTLRSIGEQSDDAAFSDELIRLERAAIDPSRPWSGTAIEAGLAKLRRSKPARGVKSRSSLPQLNP